MTLRLVPHLADQAIGFRAETGVLLIAQRWTGFPGGRHAFVLSRNDEVTGQRAGPPGRVADEYAAAARQLAKWVVTEDRARDHLEEMGQPRQRQCADRECDAKLPLGGLYCTVCGLNQGTVVVPTRRRIT